MGNLGTTGIQGSNESESRLILQGAELVITNHFTDIEPLYTSARGHAALYRAKRMGKWHVLKCLKAGHSGNPLYLGLLQKEFEISYNLSHPNIVQTIGFESVDGLGPCIVMEYIDGRTLRSVLDERKMTRDEARQVILQTCKALEYIHSRQIIHRDLKPENIMLTGNGGNVKLIDFGYSDTDSYAVLKQPAGTRRYAAPEQMAGQTADTRADIYALGVIIGEINCALPHKWMRLGRISARCTKAGADQRYASAAKIETALTPTHTPGKAAVTAFAVTAAVAAAAFTILGGGNEATQTGHVSRPTPPTARQTPHPTPDTIYIKQEEKPVLPMANVTEKAIDSFSQDKRLATLCKLAREKTLAMLQADERILGDSSVPLQERLDLEGGQFMKIEQAIKDETARIINRSSPEYPLYKTAALDAMRDTYKSFQRKKYGQKTESEK